ncbi:MAG: hypothetical protein ACREE0_18845 [Phenylobacterium sp.]
MIAILLAAQLSAEIERGPPADLVVAAKPAVRESSELIRIRRFRVATAGACSAATRLQTSAPTPTLLFRQQDRAAAHARKLKDLPPGELCLAQAESGK